ncbi:MAG: DUF359 domain-containing protein [Promethearchaeota archaeon]
MEYNLRIPQNQRHQFTDPLDILIAGNREDTIAQVENIFREYLKSGTKIEFYIVGDIVAKDFFSNQFLKNYVQVCIIDEKTKRNQIKITFGEFFEKIIKFKNPEGTINKDAWKLFGNIIKSRKKTLIKITEGEEDLLVLPLILKVPTDEKVKHFVFYGQPPITDSQFIIPEGIVIVTIDANIKQKVQKLINIMEKY